ncbi:MAG TPA: hypothetical protein PLZ55_12240 [bacterium]|nr:hypothetical protein [bacterium]HPO09432.1 hypothetical protein [bacterium]HQO36566.1 hypothetical protein [bacterium]HQP99232.1 hypothetical protein [bacterium]
MSASVYNRQEPHKHIDSYPALPVGPLNEEWIHNFRDLSENPNELANMHQGKELTSLLWQTIQDDLLHFLEPGTEPKTPQKNIHNQNVLLELIQEEINIEEDETETAVRRLWSVEIRSAGKKRRIDRTRRWLVPYPHIRELRGLPSDEKKRKEEEEHFLGGGNPRRPSEN